MKKLLIFTISILLFINLFASNAFASNVTITGSDVYCKPGETVTISFSISENSGIGAAGFDLTYNKDIFTYVEHEEGPAFSNGMPLGNDLGNGTFKYAFVHVDGIKKGGVMFSVTFEVSKKAKLGEKYAFTLIVDNLSKAAFDPVTGKYETIALSNIISYAIIGDASTPITSTPITSPGVANSTVSSNTQEAVSSVTEQKSDESYYHPILTITSTDTDANSASNSNVLLYVVIAILSVLAVSLVVTMVILIIKAQSNNKKEK